MTNDWLTTSLPKLLQDYEPKDVFNIDETGLFFRCLPDKTFTFQDEKCSGAKDPRE